MIQGGAVLIRDGKVVEVGPRQRVENLAVARGAFEINATGRVVMPGFVDSHTHLVYPPRGKQGADEESAGRALRAMTAGNLEAKARVYLDAMARHGTTTVEVKTGSGLDESSELKLLRAATGLQNGPVDVVRTFLLRIPKDATSVEAAQAVNDFAPRILRRPLADFADFWWDGDLQRREAAERFLQIAAALGIGRKVHATGSNVEPAMALAAAHDAASVDHLEKLTDPARELLSRTDTVATMIPWRACADGSTGAARRLIDAGAAVALASGFNPHQTPTLSMQTVVALACQELRMTVEEAIAAATINAAHALCRADRVGSIEPGKAADLLLLNCGDYQEMTHCFGANLVHATIKSGVLLYQEGALHYTPRPL
jgi:imidazolonepropionase